MATTETRPFLTARASAVNVEFRSRNPAVPLDEVRNHWQPGQPITLVARASITEKFWVDTYIGMDEELELVVTATSPVVRTQWVARSKFDVANHLGTATAEVTMDGDSIAVLAQLTAWISGPGRTVQSEDGPVHRAAKLWELDQPISINLAEDSGLFPVGAFSFSANHRREVPWELEIDEASEPHAQISSCMRLYVNSDLPNARAIGLGRIEENHLIALDCDVVFGVLSHLGKLRKGVGETEIFDAAERNPESLAALGLSLAEMIGVQPTEAMRLAHEEPMTLIQLSRQALEYLHKEVSS